MNYRLILALINTLFTYAYASSSSSSSSSADSDSSSVADSVSETEPNCLACPPPRKVFKNCGKRKTLYLTERTCYTCPKYKCVKNKYVTGGESKTCRKHIPSCNGCSSDETCLVTVQTSYACPKAKCVPKLLNQDRILDYMISV